MDESIFCSWSGCKKVREVEGLCQEHLDKTHALEYRKQGIKFDQDKLKYHLVNPYAQEEFVKVLTAGARKYGDRNWENGIDKERLISACLRHIQEYLKGNTIDEIGTHHLANSICNLHFILAFEIDPKLTPKPNPEDNNAHPVPENRTEDSENFPASQTTWCSHCERWCNIDHGGEQKYTCGDCGAKLHPYFFVHKHKAPVSSC